MYQILMADEVHPVTPQLVKAKFSLGQIVATPGALAAMEKAPCSPLSLLARHLSGDWGTLPVEDAALNDQALTSEGRLLSCYPIGSDTRIWVITEWDRSVTTLLLPSEY